MTSFVCGVQLIALVYAWSQKGVSFFVSTCGKTEQSDKPYPSHFEDEFGFVDYKELPRPRLSEFLFEYLPLIDEHNRQRQDRLALEKTFTTKDAFFRLLTTLVGMSLVAHSISIEDDARDFGGS